MCRKKKVLDLKFPDFSTYQISDGSDYDLVLFTTAESSKVLSIEDDE
jgi:hypothetical protein